MITAMNGERHSVGLLRGGHTKGNRQHDCIAVRHDGNLHRFFGVMPVGNIDIVGEGRAGKARADSPYVDDLMGNAEPFGTGFGRIQFLSVALAIVEGEEGCELMFGCYSISKRNRIESAGADDERFHKSGFLVLTG